MRALNLSIILLAAASQISFGALQFTRQPQNQIIWLGAPASFTVAAKGAKNLTYQWKKDGVDLIGQTNKFLRIQKTTANDWGRYTARVSSGSNIVESQSAVLVVQGGFLAENEFFEDADSKIGILTNEEYGNLFSEISSGKLRFQYSSGISASEDTTYWFWARSPKRGQSFDVRIDGTDTTQGKLQFVATCDPGGLSYRIERNGSSQTFNAGSWGDPPLKVQRVYVSTTSTQFSFRLVYDAASKVPTLKAYYDQDGPLNGESWTLLQTVNKPNFIAGRPILLGVCYNNNQSGDPLDGENVTVDNFQALQP